MGEARRPLTDEARVAQAVREAHRERDRVYVAWLVGVTEKLAWVAGAAMLIAAIWPAGTSLLLVFGWPLLLIGVPFFGICWIVALVCARHGGAYPGPVRKRLIRGLLVLAIAGGLSDAGIPCSLAFACVRDDFEGIVAAVREHEQQLRAARLSGDEQALARLQQVADPRRWYGRIGVFRVRGSDSDRNGGVVFHVSRAQLLLFDSAIGALAWTPDGQPPATVGHYGHWAEPLHGHPGWFRVGGVEDW